MHVKNAMNRFMSKLLDLKSALYYRIKRAAVPLISVIVLGFVLTAYLANIPVSEATDELYRTLDGIFYLFCGLLPVAVAAGVFLGIVAYKRRKIYLTRFNKSRLNKRVYPFDVVLAILMGLFCLLCIYPIWYVVVGSFNQGADYTSGGVFFYPRVFTFENYKIVLAKQELWHSYMITIGRTLLGTFLSRMFTAAGGYAMSRPNLKCQRAFYWISIFTMFFGRGLIPYFLIIRSIGLYGTFWVYIIPGLYSVYNMIVLQSGFKSISPEIHDAAVVDGAGEFRIWWQIYMPLSKPVLATIVLWVAVGHWNNYFDTMIYASEKNLWTLQYYLLQTINSATGKEGASEIQQNLNPMTISLAAIIVSIIPVFFFFPLIRKNFASGIMVGSLKG